MSRVLLPIAVVAALGLGVWALWGPDGDAPTTDPEDLTPAAASGAGDPASATDSQQSAAAQSRRPAERDADAITGRVLGPDGQVVVGAVVTLHRMLSPWPERRSEPIESTTTDAAGRFAFRAPHGHDRMIEVTHPDLCKRLVVAHEAVGNTTIRMRGGFELTGYVIGPFGKRVADCTVTLEPDPNADFRAESAVTDRRGQFRFRNVDPVIAGAARLTARYRGLRPATRPDVTIGSDEPAILQFPHGPGASLEGRVIRAGDRRPVADAEVLVYPSTNWNGGLYLPYQARTDEDGQFRVTGLGSGNARVIVRHAEFSTTARVVNLARPVPLMMFELVGRSRVTGLLNGDGVAGLELILTMPQALEIGRTVVEDDGRFGFDRSFSAGSAIIEVAGGARSFLKSSGRSMFINIEEAEQTVLELAVGAPSCLEGQVVDVSGAPLAGVEVSTARFPYLPRNPERLVTATDSEGAYRFAGLAAGSVILSFDHPDFASESVEATVTPGETVVVDAVAMVRPGSIRGRVARADGRPLPGATVFTGRRRDAATAVSGPDGRYELRNLAPGEYRVMARYPTKPLVVAPGRSVVASGGVTDTVDLEFPKGREIRGIVADPESFGVENALVLVAGRTGLFTWTDANGTFALEIPEGNAELQVFSPDFRIDVREEIGASLNMIAIRLPLVSRGIITAKVLGLPGKRPVANGVVRITALDEREQKWDENTRRQRNPKPVWVEMLGGRLHLESFPAGRSRLTLHCPGYAPYVREEVVVVRQKTLDLGTILLEPGARVRGIVTNEAGEPVAGAVVHLGEVVEMFDEGRRPQFMTDPQGRFEIGGVGPDADQLVVVADGYTAFTTRLRLPEDLLRSDPIPVSLVPSSTIEVQLFEGDEPLSELRLIALFYDGDLLNARPSDADGHLSLTAPLPGRYQVVEFGRPLEDAIVVDVAADPATHRVRIDVARAK